MFNSITSNFGAPRIEFKNFQSAHEIVLNAVFEFNADNDAFRAASVLEIKVPELGIDRSAVTGCYFAAKIGDNWVGTIAKCWIKDRNTICIEKLDAWADYPLRKVWFCTLFGTRGSHELEFETIPMSPFNPRQTDSMGYVSSRFYYTNEDFMFFAWSYSSLVVGYEEKTNVITNQFGFPENVDVVVPLCTGLTVEGQPGVVIIDCPFKDASVTLAGLPSGIQTELGYSPFLFMYAVRDKE